MSSLLDATCRSHVHFRGFTTSTDVGGMTAADDGLIAETLPERELEVPLVLTIMPTADRIERVEVVSVRDFEHAQDRQK